MADDKTKPGGQDRMRINVTLNIAEADAASGIVAAKHVPDSERGQQSHEVPTQSA